MAAESRWVTVPVGELVVRPDRYRFSCPADPTPAALADSVARHGLLRPPLAAAEGGGWVLVAGHRRVAALRTAGLDAVPVRAVDIVDRPALWDLLLEDQLASGPLNPVEQGRYLRLRTADTGEPLEQLTSSVFPRLGLPPRVGAARDPLWISDLPEDLRQAFADGRLPTQGVRLLAGAPKDDAVAVLERLSRTRVGVNRFGELARSILECAWRDGLSAAAWLEREGLADRPGDPDALRAEVRRRRYPALAGHEDRFRRDLADLGLPGGVRVAHPRGFEGGRLTLSVSFETLDDLGRILDRLRHDLGAGRLAPLRRYLR